MMVLIIVISKILIHLYYNDYDHTCKQRHLLLYCCDAGPAEALHNWSGQT